MKFISFLSAFFRFLLLCRRNGAEAIAQFILTHPMFYKIKPEATGRQFRFHKILLILR